MKNVANIYIGLKKNMNKIDSYNKSNLPTNVININVRRIKAQNRDLRKELQSC